MTQLEETNAILTQELSAWKHTAEVYEQRYEVMRFLAITNTVVCTGIMLIGAALMLILKLQ